MNRLLLSTVTVLSLLGSGCAATSGAQSSTHGSPLGDASVEPLRLEGTAVTGPTSSLVIDQDSMRGRFRTRHVALQWNHQEMTGSFGELAIRLALSEGSETRVSGTFAGLALDLTEDGTWLHGRVGLCAYALKRDGDTLKGMRDCGRTLERGVEVTFPQELQTRPVGERAALMALMLINTKISDAAPRPTARPRGGTERLGEISSCGNFPF
ncbi:hypothetical protein ACLESO_09925 [Pyxidicoccus sp. 3LG]